MTFKKRLAWGVVATAVVMAAAGLFFDAERFLQGFIPSIDELMVVITALSAAVDLATRNNNWIFTSILFIGVIVVATAAELWDRRTENLHITGSNEAGKRTQSNRREDIRLERRTT